MQVEIGLDQNLWLLWVLGRDDLVTPLTISNKLRPQSAQKQNQ